MALYLDHFGLQEAPFRITPHPDFFFDGADRGATLEALVYAILHDEGIVKVSGEIGSGKTMLCRVLMERLPREVETVFLANPSYSRAEILHAVADELGIEPPAESGALALRELQSHLIGEYARGRRVVILIDEAHAMPGDALEQVRLLSNLESSRHKLLQIVLFGQPELDEALDRPSLRQLKDRITHGFRMRPLTEEEVAKYVSFRMRAAGYRGPDVFSPAALAAIARASSGLTRRINVLADKALLCAFAENTHAVTPRQVRAAIRDSDFAPLGAVGRRRGAYVAAGAALLVCGALAGAGALWFFQERTPAPPPVAAPPAAAVSAAIAASAPALAAAPETADAGPVAEAGAEAQPPESSPVKPETPLLAREQLRRIDGYAAGNNRLLRERIAAARETLEREPDAHYSIELFVAENSDAARMERFLLRAREMVPLDGLYVIPVNAGSRYHIRVVFGVFPDREAALEAARRLPPKYQRAFENEPRSFAELRASV